MLPENVIVVAVQSNIVLFDVGEKVIGSQNFCDLDKLIIVVLSLEEWLLLENHSCEHAPEGPDIEGVVIGLEVNEELRSLEVSGGDSHIVLLLRVVKFSETPIDKSQSLVVVVDHDVVRLHISVHDSLRVAVVQSLKHFIDVKSDVVICEALVKSSEVNVTSINILHDQSWGLGHWVSYHID